MSLLKTVIRLITENIENKKPIEKESDLRKDLDLDSFDVLMIMNAIDDEFSISLENDDFMEVKTPNDIVKLLKSKYGVE